MDVRAENTIDLALRVGAALTEEAIPFAVIGAMAMAAHGYQRATADFDIGAIGEPFQQLERVARRLREEGLVVRLETPDADDPLGGVLTIEAEGCDPVQVVNFMNPLQIESGAVGRRRQINPATSPARAGRVCSACP